VHHRPALVWWRHDNDAHHRTRYAPGGAPRHPAHGGRPVSFITLGTYRIRAGKIIEVWAARDMLGVAHQLGATLMPPTDT